MNHFDCVTLLWCVERSLQYCRERLQAYESISELEGQLTSDELEAVAFYKQMIKDIDSARNSFMKDK